MCSLLGFSFQNPYFNQKATAFPHFLSSSKTSFSFPKSPNFETLATDHRAEGSATDRPEEPSGADSHQAASAHTRPPRPESELARPGSRPRAPWEFGVSPTPATARGGVLHSVPIYIAEGSCRPGRKTSPRASCRRRIGPRRSY